MFSVQHKFTNFLCICVYCSVCTCVGQAQIRIQFSGDVSAAGAPHQAEFGTNTEIQYFSVFAVYVTNKFSMYLDIFVRKR